MTIKAMYDSLATDNIYFIFLKLEPWAKVTPPVGVTLAHHSLTWRSNVYPPLG